MKKITTLLIMLTSFLFFSTSALAVEAEGTIDEVRICGSGNGGTGWKNHVLFKLSTGQWFYSYANWAGVSHDYDGNFVYSHVMTAYSSRYKVKVKASHAPPAAGFDCGVGSVAAGLWDTSGDDIAITEYSQP